MDEEKEALAEGRMVLSNLTYENREEEGYN